MRAGVLTGIVIALIAAAPASGAAVSIKDNSIVFQAIAGEVNRPQINNRSGVVAVFDPAGTIAGQGCVLSTQVEGTVECPTAGIESMVVRLEDGDDSLQTSPGIGANLPSTIKLSVEAGRGADTVYGTKQRDRLLGESGNDLLYGAGGRDRIIGGGNRDRLQGQGWLYGNSGNDTLNLFVTGQRIGSRAYGGAGNDRVLGGNKVRDIVDCGIGRGDAFTTTDRRGLDRFRRCENAF